MVVYFFQHNNFDLIFPSSDIFNRYYNYNIRSIARNIIIKIAAGIIGPAASYLLFYGVVNVVKSLLSILSIASVKYFSSSGVIGLSSISAAVLENSAY